MTRFQFCQIELETVGEELGMVNRGHPGVVDQDIDSAEAAHRRH